MFRDELITGSRLQNLVIFKDSNDGLSFADSRYENFYWINTVVFFASCMLANSTDYVNCFPGCLAVIVAIQNYRINAWDDYETDPINYYISISGYSNKVTTIQQKYFFHTSHNPIFL